jgi:hypothetical protein
MLNRRMSCLPPIVLALVLAETPAISQSAASYVVGVGLHDGCRAATIPNMDVIFLGRPLVAGTSDGSRPVPMHVERAFRGISASTVSVLWHGDASFDSKRLYLVYGHRASEGSVVEIQAFTPAETAQRAIQLFTRAMPERGLVTLIGIVAAGSRQDGATSVPLNGVRIRVLSEGFAMDVFTQPDGSFTAAGIPPGRLELMPFLPVSLKVLDPRTLTYTAAADACVLEMISVVSSGRTR